MKLISGLLSMVLVIMLVVGGLGAALYYQFEKPGPLEVTRPFVVPRGMGRIEIAARLENEGIIANRWAFVAAHLAQGFMAVRRSNELKAGEYEIKKNASMRQVLDALMDGRTLLTSVLVQPGLTSQQIVEKLKNDANLAGDLGEIPAEGTLLPETYKLGRGLTRAELIERMRVDQQKLLAGLWEKRQAGLPFDTPEQAVVLASIVERETGAKDEREKVAAVFVNRLRKGMRLQSDPTILYGLYGGAVQWGKPILKSEIESKTAHNTYQINGLPPTPICNPGRPAIEAVLNPAKTNDLYFVADGQGGHTFTETLKDHNAAVQVWRKHERDVRAAKLEAARAAAAQNGTPLPPVADEEPPETPAAAAPAAPAAPAPAAAGPKKKKP